MAPAARSAAWTTGPPWKIAGRLFGAQLRQRRIPESVGECILSSQVQAVCFTLWEKTYKNVSENTSEKERPRGVHPNSHQADLWVQPPRLWLAVPSWEAAPAGVPRGCVRENIGFLPPSRSGTKTLGHSPLPCLSHSARPRPSAVTVTSNSDGGPAPEMPRARHGFTGTLAFPEMLLVCPSPSCALSLPASLRDRGTVPGEE